MRDFVTALAARGEYLFSSADARKAMDVSADAAKMALNRLAKQGLVASPGRGYYVIVSPEYRSLGCLPAEQFIPELMKRQGLSYYAGLLSAAQFHGAAHHRPQEFQVVVAKARRPIICGKVRVAFFVRKSLAAIPTQSFNTPRGTILVSSPEATAFDLVGYHAQTGGLDQVATMLSELAESIAPDKLAAIAATAPVPWAQRLGYLLDRAGVGDKTAPLKTYVDTHARRITPLLAAANMTGMPRDEVWKIAVNVAVEAEF
ncbi:MAG: type IV toxin-antitoxin system AbiEi family antitoxin [Microvirga sp.]